MKQAKKALVLGAGGFIGGHLVIHLLTQGYDVYGVDIKEHEYLNLRALGCKFLIRDLRDQYQVNKTFELTKFDEIYQLAADMGGASYIFVGDNDANIMHNSAAINLNVLEAVSSKNRDAKIFYSSSACIYPERNQLDPLNPICSENSAYPAAPDSEYGWEKLFSERLYLAYARNKGIDVRIARFHNIFGPQGTWKGGKEKAPAAICRKVAETQTGNIEIWGDGEQTRSFLYIDECIDGVMRLMKQSEFVGPVNIGSSEMVSINELVTRVAKIANKSITVTHVPGPLGVRGRCSDNNLVKQKLNWAPSRPLNEGLEKTYIWVQKKVNEQ